eukprot:6440840-Prymnesium_polylepis.1
MFFGGAGHHLGVHEARKGARFVARLPVCSPARARVAEQPACSAGSRGWATAPALRSPARAAAAADK